MRGKRGMVGFLVNVDGSGRSRGRSNGVDWLRISDSSVGGMGILGGLVCHCKRVKRGILVGRIARHCRGGAGGHNGVI